MQDLIKLIEQLGSPRVVVVGDFMLDRYVYGDVERINPEAPVPILRLVRQESIVGGAGRVAAAVGALGGTAECIGVIGDDEHGQELADLLTAAGASTSRFVRDADRPTTVKSRYVGLAQHRHAQQMFRVDTESLAPLTQAICGKLGEAMVAGLSGAGVVALEDYDKGVLTDDTTPALIAQATKAGLKVLVDPACIEDYTRYRGATLLTPNRYEAQVASGVEITDDASLTEAAQKILAAAEAQCVVITLDKEGAFLLTADGREQHFPHSHPRSVYDVSGAGDVVLAALAVALAGGSSLDQAIDLANVAAGLEVERFGFVPVTRQEVVDELNKLLGLRAHKAVDRDWLAGQLARRREAGDKVIFTNGCFDLLHMGHVRYLQQARQLGNCLVVAINSDDSVARLKGPDRPVIGQTERAEMLAALECVDYVTVFDEDTAEPLLALLQPDIFAKGGSTPVVVERAVVENYGGNVVTLDLVEGQSTTAIIERILAGGDTPQAN